MFSQLVRFGLVGISGAVMNLLVFALAIRVFGLDPNAGATIAFAVAVTSNYSFNRFWTFRSVAGTAVAYAPGLWRYVTINLVGFGVNLAILNATIQLAGRHHSLEGQGLGIASGMLFNFFLSKTLVFARRRHE